MRKLLLVQFNSSMLTKDEDEQAKAYYDKLYHTRPGYNRFGPTWEIPMWMAEVLYNFPEADVLFADNMAQVLNRMHDYDDLAFSALDCNKHLIREVADRFLGHIYVGGYLSNPLSYFRNNPNIFWFDMIQSLCDYYDVPYKPGVDYRHFTGAKTIARLSMSTGCSNRCKFCIVPYGVKAVPHGQIVQQYHSILAARLDTPLIYIDDKTFGQSENHIDLPLIWQTIRLRWERAMLSEFDGFIIQTTASQLLKFDDDFLLSSGIRCVELGIESYNNEILRAMNKPAREGTIDLAVDKLRRLGIKVIPNIMIGLPGETYLTYCDTIDWLYDNINAISHVNIYTYVDYGNTDCVDENRGGSTGLEKTFASCLYDFGNLALDGG